MRIYDPSPHVVVRWNAKHTANARPTSTCRGVLNSRCSRTPIFHFGVTGCIIPSLPYFFSCEWDRHTGMYRIVLKQHHMEYCSRVNPPPRALAGIIT
ncbi:unnamed protein product [Periconia digitata]|uniref:Uncharacterized protein n=1 Tax=Periconia digitata TaxID=1303443 RepID=A0A9W4UI23_9PLEO|nr:unnamed protein product [Periconia digitata]